MTQPQREQGPISKVLAFAFKLPAKALGLLMNGAHLDQVAQQKAQEFIQNSDHNADKRVAKRQRQTGAGTEKDPLAVGR